MIALKLISILVSFTSLRKKTEKGNVSSPIFLTLGIFGLISGVRPGCQNESKTANSIEDALFIKCVMCFNSEFKPQVYR